MKIQIAGFLPNSLVNGEGENGGIGFRSVVFGSGCIHKCKGCQNQHMWVKDYGDSVEIEDIVAEVEKNALITHKRVTFSGGDPFFQAEEFYTLGKILKEKGYNIWCYTGYTLKEILKEGDKNKVNLLGIVDVLVDGRFIEDMTEGAQKYTGSRNQNVIHLKDVALDSVV